MTEPFLNRKEEAEIFGKAVRESSFQLILVMGEAGTGKSALMSTFRQIVNEQGIPDAMVNFRDSSYSPIDIIYRVASAVGWENCPNLKAAIEAFSQASDIVVKDNRALFGGSITVRVSAELNQRDENERKFWYGEITRALFEDFGSSRTGRLVLFLDTYERKGQSVHDWLVTQFLPLLRTQRTLQCIVAGQEVPKLDQEWTDVHVKITLGKLELHYWVEYAELKEGSLHLDLETIRGLHTYFDGKPSAMVAALRKVTEVYGSSGDSEEEKYWSLLAAYLRDLEQDERQFIKALAVFHWFDEEIAERAWGEFGSDRYFFRIYDTVQKLPFLELQPGRGFAFHELYRNAILFHWWRDLRSDYQRIAAVAAQIFEADDAFSRLERAYHLMIADPPAGRALFETLAAEFQDKGLFSYWETLNQYGLEHLQRRRLDSGSAALVWESEGQLSSIHGHTERAISQLERALEFYYQVDDSQRLIRTLYSKATYHGLIGEGDACKADLANALKIAEKANDALAAGFIAYRIAEQTQFEGNAEQARELYEGALSWFEDAEEYAMQARNIKFIAETTDPSELETVKSLYEKALPLFDKGWDQYTEWPPGDPRFSPLTFFGGFSSKEKLKLFRLASAAIDKGDCLTQLAELADEADQQAYYQRALESYQRVVTIADRMKDLRWSSRVHLRLGDAYLFLDQKAEAESHYRDALDEATRTSHSLYVGWAHVGLGTLARLASRDEEACEHYLKAKALYEEVGAISNIRWQIEPNLELLDCE